MRFKLAVAATAATMAFGGVALASANAGGSGHDDGRTLFDTTVQSTDIDLGDKGFSQGDQLIFADDLFAKKDDPKIGRAGGVCTVVRVTDAEKFSGTAQCVVTLSLPDGQITVQGLLEFTGDELPAPFDLAITGGTDAYSDAGGQVTVEETSDTEATLTLHLSN
jgi:hypothetical protein